ncbi:cellulose-binding GDSL lipase [Neurospora intermedia]|uniref:Cellulose-binding GDSL lipase n=1 Tax=Neurospora intermedia TaxID=5142 RepID=A0ABR3D6U2_NEUIN
MAALKLAFMALAPALAAAADVPLWGQCGGIGWQSAGSACTSVATCTSFNDYYYQCVPKPTSAAVITTSSKPITVSAAPTTTNKGSISTFSTSVKPSSSSTTSSSVPVPTSTSAKYLISFGDSYSQTGFDINGSKPSSSNPLGNPPLPGWTASGGLNWVGFLVSQLNTSLTLSYNFASGGATTNASLVAPFAPTVLSFVDQVAQFSGSIGASRPRPAYETPPWNSENNSLVAVWIGVNDVGNTWWMSEAEMDALYGQIMDSYFGRLQVLYDAGARNFALLGAAPIYYTPSTIGQGATTVAAQKVAIAKYNSLLASRFEAFLEVHSDATGKVVDTVAPFETAIKNPTAYGAPDATCFNEDGVSCLWFNDYHPGVQIQKLVAQAVKSAFIGTFF